MQNKAPIFFFFFPLLPKETYTNHFQKSQIYISPSPCRALCVLPGQLSSKPQFAYLCEKSSVGLVFNQICYLTLGPSACARVGVYHREGMRERGIQISWIQRYFTSFLGCVKVMLLEIFPVTLRITSPGEMKLLLIVDSVSPFPHREIQTLSKVGYWFGKQRILF